MDGSQRKSRHVSHKNVAKSKSKREIYNQKHTKYRGNIEEGQGFADVRKKKMFYNYKKLQKKEAQKQERLTQKVRELYKEEGKDAASNQERNTRNRRDRGKKTSAFVKPQAEFNKKKAEKRQKYLEHSKQQEERDKALDNYQKNKKKRQKLLAKRTERGQPHMASQMKYLLEKIEKQVGAP